MKVKDYYLFDSKKYCQDNKFGLGEFFIFTSNTIGNFGGNQYYYKAKIEYHFDFPERHERSEYCNAYSEYCRKLELHEIIAYKLLGYIQHKYEEERIPREDEET